MRKLLLWLVGVGLALLMMAGAGAWILLRSLGPPVLAAGPLGPHRPSEFGFVGVRCGLDDPVDDSARTDYVDEVAGFTTLAHVCVFDNDVRRLLTDLPDHGLRALLDVSALLFEFVPGDAPSDSGQRMRLRADATERWELFVATNREVLDAEHVAAYYLADEPVWNGASAADIAAAAELVEPDTQGVATMVIEGYPALADAVFPPQVDWVGFDRYGVGDPSTDPHYLADLATVRQRAAPGQRIALVLDSQWLSAYRWIGIDAESMGVVARNYQLLASRQPDVVALIGYTWPAGIDADQRGARDLPQQVRDTYVAIGHWILGGPRRPQS